MIDKSSKSTQTKAGNTAKQSDKTQLNESSKKDAGRGASTGRFAIPFQDTPVINPKAGTTTPTSKPKSQNDK